MASKIKKGLLVIGAVFLFSGIVWAVNLLRYHLGGNFGEAAAVWAAPKNPIGKKKKELQVGIDERFLSSTVGIRAAAKDDPATAIAALKKEAMERNKFSNDLNQVPTETGSSETTPAKPVSLVGIDLLTPQFKVERQAADGTWKEVDELAIEQLEFADYKGFWRVVVPANQQSSIPVRIHKGGHFRVISLDGNIKVGRDYPWATAPKGGPKVMNMNEKNLVNMYIMQYSDDAKTMMTGACAALVKFGERLDEKWLDASGDNHAASWETNENGARITFGANVMKDYVAAASGGYVITFEIY